MTANMRVASRELAPCSAVEPLNGHSIYNMTLLQINACGGTGEHDGARTCRKGDVAQPRALDRCNRAVVRRAPLRIRKRILNLGATSGGRQVRRTSAAWRPAV